MFPVCDWFIDVVSCVIGSPLPGILTALQASINWCANLYMKHEFDEWAQWPEHHSRQSYNSIPSVSLDILMLRNSHESSSNVRLVSMTLLLFFCHYSFLTCSDILVTVWVMTAAASIESPDLLGRSALSCESHEPPEAADHMHTFWTFHCGAALWTFNKDNIITCCLRQNELAL